MKRRATDITADCFGSDRKESGRGSFLVLELEGKRPFKEKGWPWVQVGLRGILGQEKADQVKFISEGLLVKTRNDDQTQQLLKAKYFGEHVVKVKKHERMNQSKGTIFADDLKDLDEEEIVEWLREYGVKEAKQRWRREGNKLVKTPVFELTFDSHCPPEKIRLDYVSYEVRRQYPRPLQCAACGRLGHHYASCRAPPTCLRCGGKKHGKENLTCEMKCINCEGCDHVALNNVCPKYQEEREVCKVRMDKGVTHQEARQMARTEKARPLRASYAAAVAATNDPATTDVKERMDRLERGLASVVDMLKELVASVRGSECAGLQGVKETNGSKEQSDTNRTVENQKTQNKDQNTDKTKPSTHSHEVTMTGDNMAQPGGQMVSELPAGQDQGVGGAAPGFWKVAKGRGHGRKEGCPQHMNTPEHPTSVPQSGTIFSQATLAVLESIEDDALT